ncbi:MAG: hypothetical protein ACLUD0_14445 [Eubacterium ramulus]
MGFLKPTIIGNVFWVFNKMNKQKGITDMGVKFDRLVYEVEITIRISG